MKKIKVAINGLGRIGRAFLRAARKHADNQRISADNNQRESAYLEVVAVNDLGEKANMEYLLKYDSVYGINPQPATHPPALGSFGWAGNPQQEEITFDALGIKYLSEKEPAKLPWKELGVDVVVESTGFFTSAEKSQGHIDAGAKRVVITAPIKDDTPSQSDTPSPRGPACAEYGTAGRLGTSPLKRGSGGGGQTILMGLNEEKLKDCVISSNASCTTNAASPIIAILDEAIGIEKAVLNTVHAYTATQALVDSPAGKKGFREGRAAAANIIPSSTGAAVAVAKAYSSLEGKFDGISLRVPVICGSIADITFISKRNTTAEEINSFLTKAAKEKRWQDIFAVAEDELVSSDILGRPEGAIAELSMTRVVGGNLVKVLAWYDNESGYANTLVKHVLEAGKQLI